MRPILLFLTLALPLISFAQFTDNFDDGNIDGWGGETSSFIANDSGQLQLQGDCAAGGQDYISAEVETKDSVVWEFFLDYDFDPSSSNYAKIYLQSDQPDLTLGLNGYFLKVGSDGTGDVIELYRQDDLTYVSILSGITNIATSPTLGIRVVRSPDAEWQLYLDATGGTSYTFENAAFDATYNGGNYFGIFCKYTSTRCDLFYFDNIYINPLYVDVDAPDLFSASVITPAQIELDFNETVDILTAETESNYTVDAGVGSPVNAARDATDFSKVLLTFLTPFPEATTLTVTVHDVADENGNPIISDSETFSYYTVKEYDVVMNEVLPDPEIPVALPNSEFIELYNNAVVEINLEGWYISDGGTDSDPFPALHLPAGEYLIVCKDDNAGLFSEYPNVLGINSFPSLNNDQDFLMLFDPNDQLIHSVNYTIDWYDSDLKAEGGWSLEMIDPLNPCIGDDNWTASINLAGGTPGSENSVHATHPDITNPSVLSAFPISNDTLIVYFSEYLEQELLVNTQFTVDNGIGNPLTLTTQIITPDQVKLFFPATFETGVVYTLTVEGVEDCSANEIGVFNTVQFGIPEPTEPLDVVINEVLFNPLTEGVDFVELYNRSDKIVDLSDLILAELRLDDTTDISESTFIQTSGQLFFPHTYIVLSSSSSTIASQYDLITFNNFFEPTGMPGYSDSEGIVVVFNNTLTTIDQFHYYDDWHYDLLTDENGVSLERLNYNKTTQDENNWHSASSNAGYATPGYQNSTFGNISGTGDISFEYNVFSPDGDGYHDLFLISYQTASEGFTGSIQIYDAQGRLVKDLVNNELLSREGFFTWDGLSDNSSEAKMGVYIMYAEFFNLNGQVETHKMKFTLVRKS